MFRLLSKIIKAFKFFVAYDRWLIISKSKKNLLDFYSAGLLFKLYVIRFTNNVAKRYST
jgi:hypothetical protein